MENSHTDKSDYTLLFEDILNNHGKVHFIDNVTKEENILGFTINDTELGYRAQSSLPPIVADLIDLAVAICASDRLASQSLPKKQRSLNIVVPVRYPELLNAEPFQEKLKDLLEWTTGSQWNFEFKHRTALERFSENLALSVISGDQEVALWSGGLDALAGLYNQLKTYPDKSFVLFGTGCNTQVHHRQKEVFDKVSLIFPGRINLYRLPIKFHDSKNCPKNKVSRARGVVFMLLGAACAYLMKQRELYMYENGIGAINLPYRKSAIGLDHSRSAHPLTLMMVSELISELIKEKFQIKNPFLFLTKAEMCKPLRAEEGLVLISSTKSCDSSHRKKISQCGYCSSCILRKQSIAASQIDDPTQYVVPHGIKPSGDISQQVRHMLAQVSTLESIFSADELSGCHWKALTERFVELNDVVDRCSASEDIHSSEMRERLVRLYKTYVSEWNDVGSKISANLLDPVSNQSKADEYIKVVR
jgi:7-cyano-7-deazaguanine synthase in queuosine biosynthesis